jgi:hypothetical protein
MFCAPGRYQGRRSRFHVLRPRTHFRLYRGRQIPFSYFALPDTFSAVSWASFTVLTFCAPGLVFGGSKCVGSRFHVLRDRARFRRYRGRRVPFPRFSLPDIFSVVLWALGPGFMFSLSNSFSAVQWASGPVFMFCAPRLIFGGTEGVVSRFHVLRSRTHFRRNRGVGSCFFVLHV